jgi:hypothetical protein
MQDDQLTPATANSIADGIRRKVDTLWVNHTGIDAWCYLGGYAGNVEECVTYISNTKRNQKVSVHFETATIYNRSDSSARASGTNGTLQLSLGEFRTDILPMPFRMQQWLRPLR